MSRFELWPAKRRTNDEPPTSAGLRFERLVTRSHAVLLIERLCRILLPPLIVAGLFICLAWSGLLLGAPSWARGLGLFALLFGLLGALLVPLKSFRWPTRREALARVDRATGLPHDPAAVLDDRLGNGGADPATRALWKLHRARAERAIDQLRTGGPEPRLPERDRFALRGLVLVGLVAMAFVAGPEKFARLQAAFDWRFTLADGPGYRVDAWIDPPTYTGKTPLVLKLAAGSFFTTPEPQKIEAPVGSIIVIHAPQGQLDLSFKGALAEAAKEKAGLAQGASVPSVGRPKETLSETRLALRGDATLALGRSGTPLGTFELHALPDAPPTIALSAVPKLNLRGSLTLKYKVADDYGVIRAEARFADPVLPGGRPTQRSLVEPPKMELRLPPPPDLSGEAETTADLSEHPWAGSRVKLTLVAQDEGGNEGKSETVEITLPQKPFSNPLARALVEQRRNLILAPDDRWRVGQALEALMIAPEVFKTSASAYLGLRVASDQLAAAHNDADLVAVADFLWAMALRLENGNLSEAERDLRAAESQLREALEHHAPEEEIRQLSENLRTALDKFLQQLAREQGQENNRDETAENGSNRSITPQQLQAMMDKMQAMMRDGDSEGAQRMLEQLQNILENLRTARPHQADPRRQAMRHALDELGQLSQDQQDLRDETYQNGQGERHRNREENGPLLGGPREPQTLMEFFAQGGRDGSRGGEAEGQNRGSSKGHNPTEGKPPAGDPNAASDLGKRQQALRQRLEDVQKRLHDSRADGQDFDAAQEAMHEAENALGQGPSANGEAVDAQGRAVEALRNGAQKLAEAMNGQDGEQGAGQQGEGEDGQGLPGLFGGSEGTDPLGRPSGSERALNPNARFDPMGVPAAERARRVLEELRRRLGEIGRPREELDYFERLLRRY